MHRRLSITDVRSQEVKDQFKLTNQKHFGILVLGHTHNIAISIFRRIIKKVLGKSGRQHTQNQCNQKMSRQHLYCQCLLLSNADITTINGNRDNTIVVLQKLKSDPSTKNPSVSQSHTVSQQNNRNTMTMMPPDNRYVSGVRLTHRQKYTDHPTNAIGNEEVKVTSKHKHKLRQLPYETYSISI